jgi:hypothetical protein
VIGSADAPIAGQGKGNIHKLIHHSVSSLVPAKKIVARVSLGKGNSADAKASDSSFRIGFLGRMAD